MHMLTMTHPLQSLFSWWPFLPWSRRDEHALLKANREYFTAFSQDKPLTEYEFVVFDTELTGLNERRDEVVSIGAVRIREMRIDLQNCFYTCIQPNQYVPKSSTLIHRITPCQTEEAPKLETVLPEFVSFCGQALLVGHNIGLDIGFMNRALKKHLGGALHNPCLDTMRLAMLYKESQWENYYDRYNLNVSYTLTDLSKEYGLPLFDEHNALQDAMQTAYLFLFFVHKLHGGKIKTLRDLFLAGRSWRWV
ncbi:DNA polymerase-3 subunit epsilon [Desulfonatronum zhilinae]|nr:DNA polymerase-3 subunit epsilon [Desulfonatronum zhilinae]